MIYIGSDHAGYERKQEIEAYLKGKGEDVVDLGVFAAEPPMDYPDIAHEVAEKVRQTHGARGILVCGSGVGMCMTANKKHGIRAVHGERNDSVEMSRKHNDANILCLGARMLSKEESFQFIDTFLSTEFEAGEERHVRRVDKIEPAAQPHA
ncbi:ribose 5-phosphate isomerase B [Candidatus Peregrinibacteria bacterium CG11_big_fil_rev_8_21_14_0_20_46_8]|nr:MAG: ribose 5-phosphate isomerase B [Candidatus Peregrinibacteria bacterium CG11_big_fil_rev_8_21_14_0_20_46_8]